MIHLADKLMIDGHTHTQATTIPDIITICTFILINVVLTLSIELYEILKLTYLETSSVI